MLLIPSFGMNKINEAKRSKNKRLKRGNNRNGKLPKKITIKREIT